MKKYGRKDEWLNEWKWEWDVWKDVDLYRTYVWRLYAGLYKTRKHKFSDLALLDIFLLDISIRYFRYISIGYFY